MTALPDETGPELRPLLTTMSTVLLETLVERPEERVVLGGTANLTRSALDFPGTIRPVLEALEEQVVLLRLIGEVQDPSRVLVRIGEENPYEGLRSTSVVRSGTARASGPSAASGCSVRPGWTTPARCRRSRRSPATSARSSAAAAEPSRVLGGAPPAARTSGASGTRRGPPAQLGSANVARAHVRSAHVGSAHVGSAHVGSAHVGPGRTSDPRTCRSGGTCGRARSDPAGLGRGVGRRRRAGGRRGLRRPSTGRR